MKSPAHPVVTCVIVWAAHALIGSPICVAAPQAVTAACFDAVTDTIAIPGTSTLSTTATIEARVRPLGDGGGIIYDEWRVNQQDLNFGTVSSGVFAFAHPFPGSTPLVAAPALMDGRWVHIAYVYDGQQERLYRDGSLVASRSRSSSIGNSSTGINHVGGIFRDGFLNGSFRGQVDYLRISNIARYSGSTVSPPTTDPPSDANTLLLLHFDDAPGSLTASDSSPLGRNGALASGFTGATAPQLVNVCTTDIAPTCGDGVTNVADLLLVIASWGPCPSLPNGCRADLAPLAGDAEVNVSDLLAVIGAWGTCQ